MASSSSASDSQYCPRWKYDVFLSFRGEDTRKTITGYLYEHLTRRGIITFQDDKSLEHGDSIPEELLKAIEDSQVALVIFSKNYATSRWCLDELVKIMECTKEENGKTVIPVFYGVDATDVRNQSKSFAEAFAKHELKYNDGEGIQKVKGWRTALTAAANLKGYVFTNGVESDNIACIVDDISSKCKTSVSYLQKVVGINTQLEKVESLLEMEIDDVRIVWIWGMGGVGKTTIAKTIFYELSSKFKDVCFLENIKENKHSILSLQNILLSKLLGEKENCVKDKEEGRSLLARRLPSKKVLVVLDDIDHRDQLDYLAEDLGWFGKGSRIIATTRDKQLIGENDVVYEVETLLDCDAIKLFNQHAFKKENPDECFKMLSFEVVNHAKGLPLALKVWGSLLHRKGLTQWRRIVGQIKKNSRSEIVEKLKISYDGLEPEEQKIFLDMACFLRGRGKHLVMQVLESCDFGAEYGLEVLIDKSLVFISENNTIEMHDLIQDMGRYIVKMQKDSGELNRIWDAKDFEEVMLNNTGTMTMEAIWFTCFEQIRFNKEAMQNMKRLRILYIRNNYFKMDAMPSIDSEDISNGSIEYLSNNLRWVVWYHYPWVSLPEKFEPQRLVYLNLRWSLLHDLWTKRKLLPSLRWLDLSCSKRLMRTPDFTGMPNLENLHLRDSKRLAEVHRSLGNCKKLIRLDLYGCVRLKRFPCVNVESLQYLNLRNCYSLEKFPEILGRMKPELEISMGDIGIREIPSSIIQHQARLTKLNLSSLENLVRLPSSICKLKGLVKLNVSYCYALESLPKEIGHLENLEELNARCTLISRPPSSIVHLNNLKYLSFRKEKSKDGVCFVFPQVNEGLRSLKILNLRYCNLIDGGLPEDIGSLSSLKELNLRGNNFEHLPRSIAQLGALRSLDLSHCKRLKKFPGFMEMQNLDGGLPEDIGCLSSLRQLDLSGNNFEQLPRSIVQLTEQLHTIYADWGSDSICNSLFRSISLLQHDFSASDSLSLRVFTSWEENIPSWFHHRGTGTSVSVNLPENWYVSDNLLGFAVCYSGKLIDITAHLIPLCDDGMSLITQKLSLSNRSICDPQFAMHLFLVPFAGLWDTSKANGKTPNDYGLIMLCFSRKSKDFGLRLLYKDEPELEAMGENNDEQTERCIGTRRSRYDNSEQHDSVTNEASCSSSKKQRSHYNVCGSSV